MVALIDALTSPAELRAADAHVIRECLCWLVERQHRMTRENRLRVRELRHRHRQWERGI